MVVCIWGSKLRGYRNSCFQTSDQPGLTMSLPRFHIEGHVYYITTVTYARLRVFTRPSFIIPLIDSLNLYRYKQQFKLVGYVIMPDHIHVMIWPYGEAMPAEIMRDFKKFTAVRIIRQAEVEGNVDWLAAFQWAGEEAERSQNKVWQDSYWDKTIYSDQLLRQKLNYIHRNPVRSGLAERPELYAYSSYRNYVNGDDSLIEFDRDWF
jgi:putative transposase